MEGPLIGRAATGENFRRVPASCKTVWTGFRPLLTPGIYHRCDGPFSAGSSIAKFANPSAV